MAVCIWNDHRHDTGPVRAITTIITTTLTPVVLRRLKADVGQFLLLVGVGTAGDARPLDGPTTATSPTT